MHIPSIFILVSCVICGSVCADGTKEERQKLANELVTKGIDAYKAGNYDKAAAYYKESIIQWKNVRAEANLCNLYLYGQGVPQDYYEAKNLCEMAAQHNDTHALVMLGEMYLFGNGVKLDEQAAITYYRKAADAGHVHGQYVLGTLLLKTSPDEAKFYLQKAANRGYERAKKELDALSHPSK